MISFIIYVWHSVNVFALLSFAYKWYKDRKHGENQVTIDCYLCDFMYKNAFANWSKEQIDNRFIEINKAITPLLYAKTFDFLPFYSIHFLHKLKRI